MTEGLFWSIGIEFELLEHDGEQLACSMSADWIVLDVRDWRELEGVAVEGGREKIDASFYVHEHNEASWTQVVFGERNGYDFRVIFDMMVELPGLGEDSADLNTSIHADVAIPYVGFNISREAVEGVPQNEGKAIEVAKRYVDLSCVCCRKQSLPRGGHSPVCTKSR